MPIQKLKQARLMYNKFQKRLQECFDVNRGNLPFGHRGSPHCAMGEMSSGMILRLTYKLGPKMTAHRQKRSPSTPCLPWRRNLVPSPHGHKIILKFMLNKLLYLKKLFLIFFAFVRLWYSCLKCVRWLCAILKSKKILTWKTWPFQKYKLMVQLQYYQVCNNLFGIMLFTPAIKLRQLLFFNWKTCKECIYKFCEVVLVPTLLGVLWSCGEYTLKLDKIKIIKCDK